MPNHEILSSKPTLNPMGLGGLGAGYEIAVSGRQSAVASRHDVTEWLQAVCAYKMLTIVQDYCITVRSSLLQTTRKLERKYSTGRKGDH
jgi:hypothetical protein